MFNHRAQGLFFGLAGPLLFILLQVPCVDLDARPESDQNPVGSRHTVTVDVEGDGDWLLLFAVEFGPNEGANSLCGDDDFITCEEDISDCLGLVIIGPGIEDELEECLPDADCDPSCFGSGNDTVRWTYRSNGDEGEDVIVVCALDLEFEGLPGVLGQIGALQNDLPEEILEEIEFLEEELGCDAVFKEWVEDDEDEDDDGPPPNVGGIFAGDLDAAQRNRERARASVAPATAPPPAAAAPIRPPSTGDAGLRD
jgi:hypothetical protein